MHEGGQFRGGKIVFSSRTRALSRRRRGLPLHIRRRVPLRYRVRHLDAPQQPLAELPPSSADANAPTAVKSSSPSRRIEGTAISPRPQFITTPSRAHSSPRVPTCSKTGPHTRSARRKKRAARGEPTLKDLKHKMRNRYNRRVECSSSDFTDRYNQFAEQLSGGPLRYEKLYKWVFEEFSRNSAKSPKTSIQNTE